MPVTTIDGYVAAAPIAAQPSLRTVVALIRALLPDAEERIAYGLAGWRLQGRPVLYVGGWQSHWAIYPAGPSAIVALQDELAPYLVAKGTIRFPIDKVPVALVKKIVRLRADAARAEAAAKKPTTKKAAAKKPARKPAVKKPAVKKPVTKKAAARPR